MKVERRYRVMECEYGDSVVHTDDLEVEEAEELAKHLSNTFQDLVFYVEPYDHIGLEERYYNEDAVDGWEDMYPYNDDY